MVRRLLIMLLAVVFLGSMSLIQSVDLVNAAAQCACGKDCKCEHCMTGKGECKCHAGATTTAKPVSDADYATTMKSKKGLFMATYIGEIPINKIVSWTLKVDTAEGQAVTDAEIAVSGDMPEHGHGLPTEPKVTKNIGDGTYLVEGIKFSMPGWWTMTFEIRAEGKTDNVTFNLRVKS